MRRQTPGTKSTPDMLAAIDGAVDERCACGCGAKLNPNGPSAWYATEACQRRYMGGRAADEDWNIGWVPAAREAAERLRVVQARAFARPTVVQLPAPEPSGEWAAGERFRFAFEPGWLPAGSCPLPFRRRCPRCNRGVEVRDLVRWRASHSSTRSYAFGLDLVGDIDFSVTDAQACTTCDLGSDSTPGSTTPGGVRRVHPHDLPATGRSGRVHRIGGRR